MKTLMIKLKPAVLVCLFLFSLALPLCAGLIFDDPIDVQAARIPHVLGKDEIKFFPSGECAGFMIYAVDATLELQYTTGKRTIHVTRKLWTKAEPMMVELPDNLAGLESFRLKGKFSSVWRFKAPLDPNAPDRQKELLSKMKLVTGYKLDSSWTAK
jgi:hypothetical protein